MTEAGRYRPEIDGLRALAVVPVVLFHAGIPGFSGGFVGVDVFFVISGFLITRIIYSELVAGRFSIVHFYERRARRILPALSVALVAATAVAAVVMMPTDLIQYAKSLGATVLFASNVWFEAQSGDYFGPTVETPLLHTWSLAVEEQFYIVFPLLLMLCVRYLPGRTRAVVALGTAASFAWAVWMVRANPNAAFFLAPSRAWELGLGSLLALELVPPVRPRAAREALGWIALALIAVPVLLYTGSTPFPGLAAVPPCLGAALILYLGEGNTIARALSRRPAVFVGLISYSLYLLHWPIIVLLEGIIADRELPLAMGIGAIAASLVLAILSWRYVERPFRSASRVSRRGIFTLSAIAGTAILALAAGLWVGRGVPARFSPATLALAEAHYDRNPHRDDCLSKSLPGLCVAGAPKARPTFLLWGDSHADALQGAVEQAGAHAGLAGYVQTRPDCLPAIGVEQFEPCNRDARAVMAFLAAHHEIDLVVLAGRWAWQRLGVRFSSVDSSPKPFRAAMPGLARLDRGALFDAAMTETVARLTAMGKTVVLVGDNPEIGWDVPARLAAAARFGTAIPPAPLPGAVAARQQPVDQLFRKLAAGYPRVQYIPVTPHFCDTICHLTANGRPLYFDDDHLSNTGALAIVAPLLEPVFQASAVRR